MVLKPFHCTGLDEFEGAYRINVLGAIKVIQTWLPALKLAGGSSVVLFGSVAANQGMPMHAGVATAKGAVEALTRTLAAEYAGQHIRFNCISPSLTDTPLAARLLNDENKRGLAAKRHPLGRYGTPEDVAAAAFFLLSDDPDWVTGQVMGVDGGLSTLRLV
jgi:NAD(P)-dependent dehydrogenase (short-subunit alcohol dehydrogenase family)